MGIHESRVDVRKILMFRYDVKEEEKKNRIYYY